jgi:hypothetical protein
MIITRIQHLVDSVIGRELPVDHVLGYGVDEPALVDLAYLLRLNAGVGVGGKASLHVQLVEYGVLIQHVQNEVIDHALLPVVGLPGVEVLGIVYFVALYLVESRLMGQEPLSGYVG